MFIVTVIIRNTRKREEEENRNGINYAESCITSLSFEETTVIRQSVGEKIEKTLTS